MFRGTRIRRREFLAASPAAPMIPVKIGTLATEDSLPLWVAENMGYFSTEGIPKVEIMLYWTLSPRSGP